MITCRRSCLILLVAAVVGLSWMSGSTGSTAQQREDNDDGRPVPLIVSEVQPEHRGGRDSGVLRRRAIKLDQAILTSPTLRSAPRVLRFDLFPGGANPVVLEATIEQTFVKSADMTIYEGSARNTAGGKSKDPGTFTMVVNGTIVAADFLVPGGNYQILPVNGTHVVEQFDPDARIVCRTKHARPRRAGGQRPTGLRDSGSVVDVLIVYSRGALEHFGSHERIATTVELARRNTNKALTGSRVDLQVRVVGVQLVSFRPTGSFDYDLGQLDDDEEIITLRRRLRADQVTLIRRGGDMWGQAYAFCSLDYGYRPLCYSQVRSDHVANYHVFSHELAHNFGCQHDVNNIDSCRLRSYSLGTYFNTPNYGSVGTIMSYIGDTRILYYSFPELTFDGVTVERRDRNNSATIREAKSIITNYYHAGN